MVARALATLFELGDGAVRVITEHVGGGFGAKGTARPHAVLAALAARRVGRPVRVVLSRPQLFSLTGYRTPTIQRIRLGADPGGRLTALDHLACSQTSTVVEFAEQTAQISRAMYSVPNLRTRHRLAALDVPTPRWMRAPGEAPGAFALECVMDELAHACGIDPIELRGPQRARPRAGGRPAVQQPPPAGLLRRGRPPVRLGRPGPAAWVAPGRGVANRHRGGVRHLPGAQLGVDGHRHRAARRQLRDQDRRRRHRPGRAHGDRAGRRRRARRGPGPRRCAHRRLRLRPCHDRRRVDGTASWTWAVTKACRQLRAELPASVRPAEPVSVRADTHDDVAALPDLLRHSFGAHFTEVRVDATPGEIRVPRMLGVFAAGRIINPRTARSQLIGGMTMGLSMALHEESITDAEFGDFVNHDLAGYHIAAYADVGVIDAHWISESDDQLNPQGVKGLGELGIVGAAAAIANAVWHATGRRYRDLPLTPARILAAAQLPGGR